MAIQRLSTIKNGFVYHYMGTCTQYIMLYCSMCHMLECLLGISPPSNTAWQPQVRVQWKFSLLHTPDLAFISFSTAALGPILLLVVVYIHLNSLYVSYSKDCGFYFTTNWHNFRVYMWTLICHIWYLSSVCLSVWLYVCLYDYVCLSVCMTVCLSVWQYVCLYDCKTVCLYVCMSVCLYVCMTVWLYVCMSVCLYVCMSVCLYVCLSVWLYDCMYDCMSVCLYVCMTVCVCLYDCMCVCLYVCMSVCLYVCMTVCLYVCRPS